MRKALLLALLVAVVGHLVWHRLRRSKERVVVGFADGSSVALGPGSPERETLVQLAGEALGA